MKQRLFIKKIGCLLFTVIFSCSLSLSLGADTDAPAAGESSVAIEEAGRPELAVLIPSQLRLPKAMSKIERQTRAVDPFGIAMTAEKALKQSKIVQQTEQEEEVDLPKPENILDEALKKIAIRGVMPSKKTVMIGARQVGMGQILAIRHEGVLFRMRLDDVTLRVLKLTDLVTGDKIGLPLNIIPESFIRISRENGQKPKLPSGASPIAGVITIE